MLLVKVLQTFLVNPSTLKNKRQFFLIKLMQWSNFYTICKVLALIGTSPACSLSSGSNQYGVRLFRLGKIFYMTTSPGNHYVAGFLLNSTISQEVVGKD
jgi:hypothetical protein